MDLLLVAEVVSVLVLGATYVGALTALVMCRRGSSVAAGIMASPNLGIETISIIFSIPKT